LRQAARRERPLRQRASEREQPLRRASEQEPRALRASERELLRQAVGRERPSRGAEQEQPSLQGGAQPRVQLTADEESSVSPKATRGASEECPDLPPRVARERRSWG